MNSGCVGLVTSPDAHNMLATHLQPQSHAHQRLWHIGCTKSSNTSPCGSGITLAVRPDSHQSFSSLRSVLGQLQPLALSSDQPQLRRIEQYLSEACPDPFRSDATTYGAFLSTSVAFSLMRRISRESVYTAGLIDLSARTINSILSNIPWCRAVHVNDVDRIDRPTLKVLARAMLLLDPRSQFSWNWYSLSDPLESRNTGEAYLESRSKLLRTLMGVCRPTVKRYEGITELKLPERVSESTSVYEISAALIVQNYDSCLLWYKNLLQSHDDELVAEALRLYALAAINTGNIDEALSALSKANKLPLSPCRRAHLCYLQGLTEAKRRYDSAMSSYYYERGLEILGGNSTHQIREDEDEDIQLERAWLLNGLALNEAILWRRSPDGNQHLRRAFGLVRQAFQLVRDGHSPTRTYLRFNLLTNSAFLLEMEGKYREAAEVFSRTFDFPSLESETTARRLRASLAYRLGVLKFRGESYDEAANLIKTAGDAELGEETWPTLERILRAQGHIEIGQGALRRARESFLRGLELCSAGRSAQGWREHARGLLASMILDGEEPKARDLAEELLEKEGISVMPSTTGQLCLSNLPSKLPPYIPEIDLEDIPPVDLNRFLGNSPALDEGGASTWRS